MLGDQLAPAAEEVRECLLAVRPLKDIFFLDLHPGQLATFPSYLVAQLGQLFFPNEQFLAGHNPFLLRNEFRFAAEIFRLRDN